MADIVSELDSIFQSICPNAENFWRGPDFCHISKRHLHAALHWFEYVANEDRRNLSNPEKRKMLGNLSQDQYNRLSTNDVGEIPETDIKNAIERVSVLIAIFKTSYALVGREHVYSIFSAPNSNPKFNGKSFKENLLSSDSTQPFYVIWKYLYDSFFYNS
ncbi:MAG: hypothetical protein EOO53_11760 [Gammaproteobacteria bacterium]|nr:MAG: hypothetical protein EOO53_11760 [Gammaproteobacteria bacterium]